MIVSLRVLVVDDEPANRANLAAFLEDEGVRVIIAESGEQALALVEGGAEFDACIMDIRLPGMDGNAAILALHALRPQTVFFIHTGSTNYTLPRELRALGIGDRDIFRKPLPDMQALLRALRMGAAQ